jgi:serine/threonine protein kinase
MKIIAGRYELHSLIGEGGMASVWRARDQTLERPVAVKLLFARDDRDRDKLVKQFVREARIAASVQHRNVIHIVDFGTTDERQPFMVMELLEGESLGQRMHREPRLSVEELMHIASLTLRGLGAVHSAGIVHRDLKPDNIFLVKDGKAGLFPKILDFGISRSVEPRSGRRSALTTQEGIIVGTPEYMSPEQARGLRDLDHRTDLYSMGVVLYEALTGRLPFNNEHVGDLIIQIVTANVPSVHELVPTVPKPISDVVAKAMAREREARFADAAQMQQALHDALDEVFPNMPRITLSEQPPAREGSSGTLPRISLERLRTLEFPLEATGNDAPLGAVRSSHVTPDNASVSIDVEVPSEPPPRSSRWLKPAVVAAAVALVVGAFYTRTSAPPDDGVRVTQLASEREAQVAAARPPLPTTTTVELRSLPESAQVELDGVKVSGPRLQLPRDARSHAIRVTAAGMAPWQVTHVASTDGAYDVVLIPIAPEATELDTKAVVGTRSPAAQPAGSSTRRKHSPARRAPVDAQQKPPSALKQLDF